MLISPSSRNVKSVDISTKEASQLGRTFFGLSSEYFKSVYEQIFLMVFKSNFSFTEAYSLPINLRNWFFDKLLKYHTDTNKVDN